MGPYSTGAGPAKMSPCNVRRAEDFGLLQVTGVRVGLYGTDRGSAMASDRVHVDNDSGGGIHVGLRGTMRGPWRATGWRLSAFKWLCRLNSLYFFSGAVEFCLPLGRSVFDNESGGVSEVLPWC